MAAINPTQLTPPRVPLVDDRTGTISREWYRFFLSLLTATEASQEEASTAPDASSLLASYDQMLADTAQALSLAPRAELGTVSAYNIGWMPYIGFDTPPPWIGSTAGQMWFDPATGAFNAKMGGNNITQQIGEELFVYGKASAAIIDTPLRIIRKTGTVGSSGVITFGPTVAGITDPHAIVGIATENIAANAFGRVTAFGVVRGINTTGSAFGEMWADNDDIWYNPTTGNPTNVVPAAPGIKVQVGTIIKAGSGGSGSIQVRILPGSTLGGTDSNVQFGTLADKDLIQYDNALGYWKNVPASSITPGGGSAPVTKTADFTVASGETWIINNKTGSTCTVTLPAASGNSGLTLTFQNYQAQYLVSASSNVVPQAGGAAGTAILENVAGNWATLVSDGTNWVIMQAAPFNIMLI